MSPVSTLETGKAVRCVERIQRVRQKHRLLTSSLGALIFTIFVATRLFQHDPLTGSAVDLAAIAFFTLYFGGLAWMILPGLATLQTLELDREELRVYVGPLMIRRIPVNAIRSVVKSTKFEGRSGRDPQYPLRVLLLRFETPAQRRERGERPMLGSSFWIEDTEEARSVLRRMLPRSVMNL